MGRPRQIAQVLVNLLVNAGQATAAGGRVRLSTAARGSEVRWRSGTRGRG